MASVLFFGLLALLVPILILYFVKGHSGRLAVVCVAIGAFAIIVATTTSASNAELLASMAA